MGTVLRNTVWDRSLLEEVPIRFRGLYTTVLPLIYFCFVLFGLLGLIARVAPTLITVTSVHYVDVWTVLVGGSALASLVGVIFRRLVLLEMYATIVLIVLFASYPVSLLIVGSLNWDVDRLALGVGLLAFLGAPTWRVFDIVRTERRRHA